MQLYFTWKFNSLHPYLSPTSCLDPDVPLNKLVRPGDKLGLSGKSPDVLFPPNSASEPVLCTTGKYPNLECFLKYFFDLNLFLSSFVKSRISSPDVVYNEKRHFEFYWKHIMARFHCNIFHGYTLTAVQYSCIGWAILWFLYFPPFPAKKQFWHMSKLKHLRHL